MMKLPPLSPQGLQYLMVCSFTPLKGAAKKLRNCFKENEGAEHGRCEDDSGSVIYIRRLIDIDSEGDGHFHLEAAVEDYFLKAPKLKTRDSKALVIPDCLVGRSIDALITGRIDLDPNSEVAKRLVKALLGVSIDVLDYEFTLTGCTFEVNGKGPLTKVRWFARDDSRISIELHLFEKIKINDELLKLTAKHVDDALSCLSGSRASLKRGVKHDARKSVT